MRPNHNKMLSILNLRELNPETALYFHLFTFLYYIILAAYALISEKGLCTLYMYISYEGLCVLCIVPTPAPPPPAH